MRGFFVSIIFFQWLSSHAQVTVSPVFPTSDQEVTIVYDAKQGTGALAGASHVIMHSGVIVSEPAGTAWEFVKGDWGNPAAPGTMTSLGNDKWQIKITPRTYYNVPPEKSIYRIGMVFRSGGPCGGFAGNNTPCKEGKSSTNGDIFIDLYENNTFRVIFSQPSVFPVFRNTGDDIVIDANTSEAASIVLKVNDATVATTSGTSISHTHTVGETAGMATVTVTADNGTETTNASFTYIIRSSTITQTRPAGIIDGVNYHAADHSKATLSVLAPGKSSVYVLGDFNDWEILPEYQMKKDGEHFWLDLEGLTAGKEYAFQYLVDEFIRIGDPYADKILDPDDKDIPSNTYPELKPFPEKAKTDKWYFNRVSVLQTGQTPFQWKHDFVKPDNKDLVIYELLVRDFFEADARNYQTLMDTIQYLKRLGINAIELMPIMEFNGNDSWGYNPTYMFAPDKYYGTKDMLKHFIDKCHEQGIAVLLDIVLNQQDVPSPYVLMDFDFTTFKPNPSNRWFNVEATHPFNVFYDMNHESSYTKTFVDTVTHYWLHEFKVDGYRFDLSKGFTQKNNPSDVSKWSARDDSRIAILKRIADEIRTHTPDAILVLEHLSDNDEEKILADHGFLLWGNLNHAFSQAAMGYASGSDISGAVHSTRGWTHPNLVAYMESHDEERMMFRNLTNGNTAGSYSVKNPDTALVRIKAAATLFFSIPGPKMFWQFGELGYDISIDHNGRTGAKPVKWDYFSDPKRHALYDHFSQMIRLRNSSKVFDTNSINITSGTTLVKQLTLKNSPYTETPASADDMNVQVVVNFDVATKTAEVNFPHIGVWYNIFDNEAVYVDKLPYAISLAAGDYKLYTDYSSSPVTSMEGNFESDIHLFPNPTDDSLIIVSHNRRILDITIYDINGKQKQIARVGDTVWNISTLPSALYVVHIRLDNMTVIKKIFKH